MEHGEHRLDFIATFVQLAAPQSDYRKFREHYGHAEEGPGLLQSSGAIGILPHPHCKLFTRLDKMQDLQAILFGQRTTK